MTFTVPANREICSEVRVCSADSSLLMVRMGEAKENEVYEEELLDYEEDDDKVVDSSAAKPSGEVAKK